LKKGPAASPPPPGVSVRPSKGTRPSARRRERWRANDVLRMVAAYMRGRGARKELKGATEAVQRALKAHGATLPSGSALRVISRAPPS